MSIANNSLFYLKNVSNGQYLTAADQGKYNWPQLGSEDNRVKLKLVRLSGAQGKEIWKILSTESSLGAKYVLGAFSDSRDCYYWKDGYSDDKQGWEITTPSGDRNISLGNAVVIRNVSYQQYLVADTKHKGYITTDKSKSENWSLVPVSIVKKKPSAPGDEAAIAATAQTEKIFQLSVASGDPTANSIILWTCLNDNKGKLTYEISESKAFTALINETPTAIDPSEFGEDRDYTVNVDVTGLKPNKTYFYRFNYEGVSSQIGRCRTLPAPNEDVKSLRLGVVTCNDYSSGYFNAFYKLAEADVHFVIHLGDFIYEYSQYPDGYGTRHRDEVAFENGPYQIPKGSEGYEGCDRAYDLKDFRKAYRTYRQDKGLQAAMEQHTWIIMLDDHELADDFYWDYERNTAGANPSHPIYKTLADRPKEADTAMMNLCRNGKQAWREYVPYRPIVDDSFDKNHPNYYRLYRKLKFGNLMEFFLSDSRSYRDKPERNINVKIQDVLHDAMEDDRKAPFADILADERKKRGLKDWQFSMLGPAQKKWLLEGVTQSASQWRVWGNQTLMASAGLNVMMGKYDDWHGFITERYEILQAIKESENKRPGGDRSSHFVVLTGDMHTSLIAYLKTDFEGTLNMLNQDYSRLVGVEFMTPAVTSPGLHEFAGAMMEGKSGGIVSGVTEGLSSLWTGIGGTQTSNPLAGVDALSALMKAGNPHIKDVDSSVNGYAIATFTPDDMTWEVYGVDKSAYEDSDQSASNGAGRQKVSTSGVEAKRVRSVRYDPSQINLDNWQSE